MLKKALALALLVPFALAGCGGGDDQKADPADLGKLQIMIPLLSAETPSPSGEMQQAIEKLTGKKLEITWVPNANYADRTNVVLAGGNIPEVMVVQGKVPSFVSAAQAGAFWDLTDKLGKYPNLTAQNKQVLKNTSINGKVYGVFRSREIMRTAVFIRKDWLEKLHLQVPETTDDLYKVAKAFTEQDPDGNGKKDTSGIIIPKWPAAYGSASPYDVIETWFGAPNAWGQVDGKLKPGFDTQQFLEADRYIKKMVDEKIINPDYATLSSDKWNDTFFNGKGGIVIDVGSRALLVQKLFAEKDAAGAGKYMTLNGNLLGPDGKRHAYPTIGYNGMLAISKQSVPSEAELDDVLKVLDKLSSREGQILLNNGIEGKNFTVRDNYATPVNSTDPALRTFKNDVTAFGQFGTGSNGQLFYTPAPSTPAEKELMDLRDKYITRDTPDAVYNPALAIVSPTYVQKGAVLDQIIADARIKYFAGQLDENGLKAEIQRWYKEGGTQITNEYNDQYAKMK
jgi:putative aldouronate transport system substrate-binding protein